MTSRRVARSIVAASICSLLAGSTGWAAQEASLADLEELKRMMLEVISENKELRTRVRDLEAEMTRLKAAMPRREPAPEQAAQATPRAPATQPAQPAPGAPAREPAKARQAPASAAAQRPPREPATGGLRPLLDKLELGGAVEAEVGWRRNFRRFSSSDLTLNSAAFDFEVKMIDWAVATLAADWDRDTDKFALDEALITLGNPRKLPLYLQAGRGVVPFGISTGATVRARLEDILTITDPLTKEVFEAKEDFLLLGAKANGFNAGAYLFNGTTNRRGPAGEKHLEHYGATLGYTLRNDIWSLNTKAGIISSVFDSDGLTETFPEAVHARYAPGVFGLLRFDLAGFSLVAEYNAAIRDTPFSLRDIVILPDGTEEVHERPVRKRPSAWMVEAGYTTELFGKRSYAALGYSQTYQLAGAFPKRRLLTTVGTWLFDGFRLALEYGHDVDYASSRGGTGRSANSVTSRLTYEW